MRFVDHQIFVEKRATAHEVKRLDLDAGADQIARGGATPLAGGVIGFIEHVEVIFECAHPRVHFFLFSARQKPNVFAHRHGDARHDDFVINLGLQRLHQARSQGQQRLAGTRLTQQCDEINLGVHQQIQRKILLAVTCGDTPHVGACMAVILERL